MPRQERLFEKNIGTQKQSLRRTKVGVCNMEIHYISNMKDNLLVLVRAQGTKEYCKDLVLSWMVADILAWS